MTGFVRGYWETGERRKWREEVESGSRKSKKKSEGKYQKRSEVFRINEETKNKTTA